jgi:hypothetical protein
MFVFSVMIAFEKGRNVMRLRWILLNMPKLTVVSLLRKFIFLFFLFCGFNIIIYNLFVHNIRIISSRRDSKGYTMRKRVSFREEEDEKMLFCVVKPEQAKKESSEKIMIYDPEMETLR